MRIYESGSGIKKPVALGLFVLALCGLLVLLCELILDQLISFYAERARSEPVVKKNLHIHRASDDARLVYELTPNAHVVRDGIEYRINPQGYRDDDFGPLTPARPGEYRVVVIGDSVAWGWGVPMGDAWPQALERRWLTESRQPELRIYNLAVNGYSTEQEVRVLEADGLAYRPDMVILNYSLNDPTVEEGGMWMYFQPIDRFEVGYRAKIFFAGLSAWLKQLTGQTGGLPRENPWDYTWMTHEALYDNVERGFERLAALRSQYPHLRILVMVTPMFDFDQHEAYPWASVHQKIAASCQQYGFDFIDTQPYFAGLDGRSVSVDIIHPNAKGHSIIRDALYETMTSNYLKDVTLTGHPVGDAGIPAP